MKKKGLIRKKEKQKQHEPEEIPRPTLRSDEEPDEENIESDVEIRKAFLITLYNADINESVIIEADDILKALVRFTEVFEEDFEFADILNLGIQETQIIK